MDTLAAADPTRRLNAALVEAAAAAAVLVLASRGDQTYHGLCLVIAIRTGMTKLGTSSRTLNLTIRHCKSTSKVKLKLT